MGPLLFLVYINDIALSSNLFKFINYADDTTRTSTLNSFECSDIRNNVNKELNKISNWLKANKLSLNVKKTKFMIFHMPQKKTEIPLLQINGANIDCVSDLNNHLNWQSHTNKVANKINKTI